MEDYTNAQLGHLMAKGFKTMHEKQDLTNGNVKANATEIVAVQLWKSTITGSMNVLKLLFVVLIIPLILHYLYTQY